MSTKWDISTDIYGIRSLVEDLKKRYVDDVDEETLALGLFGFIGDVESKKIQSAIIMTGELGNETFPTRAKLTKNILTHAIYQNISNINAVPARLTVNFGIKVSDMEKFMINKQYVFDRTCPIYIGDYEFHFDYDVILQVSQNAELATPVYSARYDMSHKNPVSTITSPYLGQPVKVRMLNDDYIIFTATIRQYTIERTIDTLVTDSVIDNKTYSFNFTNQIAGFYVYATENGKTTRLTPYFHGEPVDENEENYCRYLYIDDHTIRITFDSQSYMPGLSTYLEIEAYTTLGENGNFEYSENAEESTEFVEFTSSENGYGTITCYCKMQTDSSNGVDRKSSDELRKLVPKYALSRGYITTETDLNNYFNLISTDQNRVKLQKKVDNQLERVWYAYFVLKDDYGNIVPSNTLPIEIDTSMDVCYKSDDGRWVLPAGTCFEYTLETGICKVVDPEVIPDGYTDEFFDGEHFYYMSVYNVILNPDPLYAAFYMTTVNTTSFFTYEWVNDKCTLQFITNRNNIRRLLLSDKNTYRFTFTLMQSVLSDFGMITEDVKEDTGEVITHCKIKLVLLLYREGIPYRYAYGTLKDFSSTDYTSDWEFVLETNNSLDNNNYLKILDLLTAGSDDKNYGYFENNFDAKLYVLAQFDEEYGRYNLDNYVPHLDGYSVTNVYNVDGGITLYRNYTSMMNTKVEAITDNVFHISGMPLVGHHYMCDEDHVSYFLETLDDKRLYIENCLELVENSFDIDFKFFNTYGPCLTYTLGDNEESSIGEIDITMKFRISLISASDIYTKDNVIAYIKDYIENLNDIGDLHIPNMINDIKAEFANTINWIEYMNFNDHRLGINHMILRDVEDPHTVPEFINIRNKYDDVGNLIPCIEVETATY